MITDADRAFARAVVALARQHHMDDIEISFRCSLNVLDDDAPRERVSMKWSEGRHGEPANITLETRTFQAISENLGL